MYTQTRPLMTQPKESRIPLLTPRRTRSTGPASGGLPLPSRTISRASNQDQSDVPFSQSVIFAQNTLAQLSAIEEHREVERVANHTALTPVSPQTVAEPSPRQAFQPQLSSTLNPHDALAGPLGTVKELKGFMNGTWVGMFRTLLESPQQCRPPMC